MSRGTEGSILVSVDGVSVHVYMHAHEQTLWERQTCISSMEVWIYNTCYVCVCYMHIM